jgi:hypothetical protein
MEIIEAHSRQRGRAARNSRDYIEESEPNILHSADRRLSGAQRQSEKYELSY